VEKADVSCLEWHIDHQFRLLGKLFKLNGSLQAQIVFVFETLSRMDAPVPEEIEGVMQSTAAEMTELVALIQEQYDPSSATEQVQKP